VLAGSSCKAQTAAVAGLRRGFACAADAAAQAQPEGQAGRPTRDNNIIGTYANKGMQRTLL